MAKNFVIAGMTSNVKQELSTGALVCSLLHC
jgi:hypothetical protein